MALAGIPRELKGKQVVAYRRWLLAGKGRPQATKLAKSVKASRQTP
jgi:hypothetical protein